MTRPVRLCFVCLGNICRSPTAQGVMQHLVDEAGVADRVEIDSAGTADYHVGDPPDARSAAEAQRRGIVLEHRGQQFTAALFDDFDLVVAMDSANARDLRRRVPTPEAEAKIRLLREYDPDADRGSDARDLDVPDPYYGGESGFADVYDMVERSCRMLLAEILGTLDDE